MVQTKNVTSTQKRSRPRGVTFAAIAQVLIGLAFLSIPILGLMYASDVQAAVDAELVRQGHSATLLAENNISFTENGAAIVIPIVVALLMTALALLNLAGKRISLILSLIFQPLILLGNFAIMASQAGVVQAVESVFKSSGNAALQSLNVPALVNATNSAYPAWTSLLVDVRNVVVILGSVLVIVLLVIPSARAYFRKAKPAVN